MYKQDKKTYYFVIGLPRSGSTLLARVLDSHSKIHVEHEDHARPFVDRQDRDIFNLKWKIKKATLPFYLDNLSQDARVIITTRYMRKEQVSIIREHLGVYAKFIIIHRSKMWRAFHRFNGEVRMVPFYSLIKYSLCRGFVKRRFPYIEVTYSNMTSNPQDVFSDVCKFIGLPYEESMLNYNRFQHDTKGNAKALNFAGIVDKSKEEKISLLMVFYAVIARLRIKKTFKE
jgi:hypothetical protein